MPRTRPAIAFMIALLAAQSVSAAARPADPLSGIWNVSIAMDGEQAGDVCPMRLTLSGTAVSGVLHIGTETASVFDGTWSNGNLVLVLGTSKDKTWYLTLRGSIRPDGFRFTVPKQGDNIAADSDADTSTGRTEGINLASDETDLTWDAGLCSSTDLPPEEEPTQVRARVFLPVITKR